METTQSCDLCGAALTETPDRYACLDLCRLCADGQAYATRLAHRGFGFGERTTRSNQIRYKTLRASIPYDLGLRATFSEEGFIERIGKLFTKEVQTGDDMFDRRVFIRTETPEPVAELLESERLRAAILEVLEEIPSFDLDEHGLTLEWAPKRIPPAPPDWQVYRYAATILHSLQLYADAKGLPVIRFPGGEGGSGGHCPG